MYEPVNEDDLQFALGHWLKAHYAATRHWLSKSNPNSIKYNKAQSSAKEDTKNE